MCDHLDKTLTLLDVYLSVYGLQTRASRRKGLLLRCYLFAMRVLSFSTVIYLIYSSLLEINAKNLTQHLQLLGVHISTIITYLIFTRRSTQFEQLLIKLKFFMSNENAEQSHKFTVRVLTLWTIFIIADSLNGMAYALQKIKCKSLHIIIDVIQSAGFVLMKRVFVSVWSTFQLIIYCVVIYMLQKVESYFVNDYFMLKNVKRKQLLERWSEILETRAAIEEIFSVYPLVFMTNLFSKTFSYVFLIKLRKINKAKQMYLTITFWSYMICETLIFLGLLSLIERTNASMKSNFLRLKQKLLKSNKLIEEKYSNLLDQVESSKSLSLTAWDLFNLRKSLLLSLFANLITFAVLYDELVAANK